MIWYVFRGRYGRKLPTGYVFRKRFCIGVLPKHQRS
jgi:hypothetical protein